LGNLIFSIIFSDTNNNYRNACEVFAKGLGHIKTICIEYLEGTIGNRNNSRLGIGVSPQGADFP